MVFTNLKYIKDQGGNNVSIQFTLDNQVCYVGIDAVGNRHYDEIMKQVKAGTISIAAAD
tara:strand:+ start:353 stop:529 length:177 start_codon:yes stop_codon:yes gene_type:complete